MAKARRRDLYPMPVHALFNHPDYVSLGPAGRGMLWSICEHYWKSGAKPLPRDDDQLFAIARAHRPTWRHWKPTILGIFATVEPELGAYWRLREVKGTTIRFTSAMGGATTKAKAQLARLQEASSPLSVPAYASGAIPKSDPRLVKRTPQAPRLPQPSDRPRLRDRA